MIVKHPSNVTKSNNMYGKIKEHLEHELAEIKAAGLYKNERIIESPQRAEITVGGRQVLNLSVRTTTSAFRTIRV